MIPLLCRFVHRGAYIKPVAPGGWRCLACGAAFSDLADAGKLTLDTYERGMSLIWLSRFSADMRAEENRVQPFETPMFKVRRVRDGKLLRFGKV